MSELLPCPFCGSKDVGGASGIVHCYKCLAQVRADDTDKAANKWNTRHVPEGMALVPVEATIEIVAGFYWGGDKDLAIGNAEITEEGMSIYKAMINAAKNT